MDVSCVKTRSPARIASTGCYAGEGPEGRFRPEGREHRPFFDGRLRSTPARLSRGLGEADVERFHQVGPPLRPGLSLRTMVFEQSRCRAPPWPDRLTWLTSLLYRSRAATSSWRRDRECAACCCGLHHQLADGNLGRNGMSTVAAPACISSPRFCKSWAWTPSPACACCCHSEARSCCAC